jgi:hypothetical protein
MPPGRAAALRYVPSAYDSKDKVPRRCPQPGESTEKLAVTRHDAFSERLWALASHPTFNMRSMPTRTALAGDDFDPRNLIRLVGIAGAGYTIYRAATGRKVGFVALASAALTIVSFLGDK